MLKNFRSRDFESSTSRLQASQSPTIDSSGIGFIIGRYHQLKRSGGDISIVSMNPKVERIILLSGLTKICMIRENEDVCINALGGY